MKGLGENKYVNKEGSFVCSCSEENLAMTGLFVNKVDCFKGRRYEAAFAMTRVVAVIPTASSWDKKGKESSTFNKVDCFNGRCFEEAFAMTPLPFAPPPIPTSEPKSHFRFYASSMGRFMKPDNIIPNAFNPQSWNLYSYVNGNPVNFNDPSGHFVGGFGGGITKQMMKREYFAPPSGTAWELTAVEYMTFIWTEYYSITITKDMEGNVLSVSEPEYLYSMAGIYGRCSISPEAQQLTFNRQQISGKNILLVVIDPSSPEDAAKVAENYQSQFYDLGANCVEKASNIGELYKYEGCVFDMTFFFGHGIPSSGSFHFGGEVTITTDTIIADFAFQNKIFGTTYWIGCYSQPMAYFSSRYWQTESWGFNEIIWSTREGWIYYKPKSFVGFVP